MASRSRLTVLLYHRVGPLDGSPMDAYTVSPGRFAAQMNWLRDHGWQVVDLEQAVRDGLAKIPERSVALTFDDGFASNRRHAWPVLSDLRLPSTTFLVAERIGEVNTWDDARQGRFPLLSAKDLAEADTPLMSFHSHGATHADLPSLEGDPAALEREVASSRARLADMLPVGRLFSYAWGSWSPGVRQAVRDAGYLAACSCIGGTNGPETDPLLLRRVEVSDDDTGWRLAFKVSTGRDPWARARLRRHRPR
jgi:peptidoglycan/xylan/chitin deacetylase (PgdA/CDA1 family)